MNAFPDRYFMALCQAVEARRRLSGITPEAGRMLRQSASAGG